MSATVCVAYLGGHAASQVTIKGWLYNKRHSGKLYFLLVRDGTGVVQCVVSQKDVTPIAGRPARRRRRSAPWSWRALSARTHGPREASS